MHSDAHDPDQTPSEEVLSGARRFWKGIGELFAFLRSSLVALRDLWVAEPPEPPVPKGEDRDAP